VTNMVTLLGIPRSQVKVICVHGVKSDGAPRCTGSCCASGEADRVRRAELTTTTGVPTTTNFTGNASTSVIWEISPPNTTSVTTTHGNYSIVTNSSLSSAEKIGYLASLVEQINEQVNNGTLGDGLANLTGYPVVALSAAHLQNEEPSIAGEPASSPTAAVVGAVAGVLVVAITAFVVTARRKRAAEAAKGAAQEANRRASDIEAGGLTFVRGSVHDKQHNPGFTGAGFGDAPEAGLGDSLYNEQPNYYGNRRRAELVQDSLKVTRPKRQVTAREEPGSADAAPYLDVVPELVDRQTPAPVNFAGTQRIRTDTLWNSAPKEIKDFYNDSTGDLEAVVANNNI